MKSSEKNQAAGHVVELDGLRGLLALWVAVSHLLLWCGFAEAPVPGAIGRAFRALVYSPAAVETFFILSGFAISYLIYTRPPSYAAFMTGRFFRICPVYFTCLALGFISAALTPVVLAHAPWRETSYFDAVGALSSSETTAPWRHLGAHLTLLHGAIPKQVLANSAATLLPPAWSISVEWQYYLCALLVAALTRSAPGLLGLAGVAWFALGHERAWTNPLPAFFPLILPLFLIGIGSYHLYATFRARGAARSPTHTLIVVAAAAAAFLFRWHSVALVIWAVCFGCLFTTPSGFAGRALEGLRRLLGHALLQWLGRISYPLYLVHWPLIVFSLAALLHYKPGLSYDEAALWLLLAGVPLILGAAWLLHLWIEAPCMRLGKRLTASTARRPAPAARADAGPLPAPVHD